MTFRCRETVCLQQAGVVGVYDTLSEITCLSHSRPYDRVFRVPDR
jgi:hypothetical protein